MIPLPKTLPKYLTDEDGNRYMLVVQAEITGHWTAGYEYNYGPLVNGALSIDDALVALNFAYQQYCPLCGRWPMAVICNNAGCK